MDEELYERIKRGEVCVNHLSPLLLRFWFKVDKNGPVHPVCGQCWSWTGHINDYGYAELGSDYRHLKGHRYSWELHHGDIPTGLYVLHRCDNRSCTNPDHLFLGTALDNSQDCVQKGRSNRGERNGSAKVTAAQVLEIRRRYKKRSKHGNLRVLSEEFGVSESSIYEIVAGDTWKHLKVTDSAGSD